MAATGGSAPPKPWERARGGNTTQSPFAPSSIGGTNTATGASGADGEKKDDPAVSRNVVGTNGAVGRPMPQRPWERPGYGSGTMTSYNNRPYGGNYSNYGSNVGMPYGSSLGGTYGTGPYSSAYSGYGGVGAYGGSYGGGMYNRFSGGYGGAYGGGYGGSYGNYGGYNNMGQVGPYNGGFGPGDDPNNGPPRPPSTWQSVLHVMHGVMNFFGRIAILIDENTQAFHFFITALLQLCDRSGVLYGELARFVLRILGFRRFRTRSIAGNGTLTQGGEGPPKQIEGSFENIWSDDRSMNVEQQWNP